MENELEKTLKEQNEQAFKHESFIHEQAKEQKLANLRLVASHLTQAYIGADKSNYYNIDALIRAVLHVHNRFLTELKKQEGIE